MGEANTIIDHQNSKNQKAMRIFFRLPATCTKNLLACIDSNATLIGYVTVARTIDPKNVRGTTPGNCL